MLVKVATGIKPTSCILHVEHITHTLTETIIKFSGEPVWPIHLYAVTWKRFLHCWLSVREITSHRWIPITKGLYAEFWSFPCCGLRHHGAHVISLNDYFVLHDSIKNLHKIDLAIFFQHLQKRQFYMTPISISLDQETTWPRSINKRFNQNQRKIPFFAKFIHFYPTESFGLHQFTTILLHGEMK